MEVIKSKYLFLFSIIFSLIAYFNLVLFGVISNFIAKIYDYEIYELQIYSTMMPDFIVYTGLELIIIIITLITCDGIKKNISLTIKKQYILLLLISFFIETTTYYIILTILNGLMLLYAFFITKIFTIPLAFVISWCIINNKKKNLMH